jgi:class 3 adenylate cyclase
LFGSGFGQDGSTANLGISPACAGADALSWVAMQMAAARDRVAMAHIKRPRLRIGVMTSSRLFVFCF